MTSTLTAAAITKRLHTATLGRTLFVHDRLPSTNDAAKALGPAAAHGTVIVAASQSGGRGRRGRSFFSPAGGIYMSVLLRDGLSTDTVGLLTTATAVATARAIERLTPLSVQIKWVNDLLVAGKKLCGILTEGTPTPDGQYPFAVVGIGVNVQKNAFPPELENIATAIGNVCAPPDRAALIAAILEELEEVLPALQTPALRATLLDEYRRRSAVLGKTVTVLRGDTAFSARAIDIDDTGALILQTETDTIPLSSGEVSVRL